MSVVMGNRTLRVVSGSAELKPAPFNPDETRLFDYDFDLLARSLQSLSRDLSEIFLSKKEDYLYMAQVAKAQLGESLEFQGLGATAAGQLGMQLIRAITVRNSGITSGTPVMNWIQTYTSTGWTTLFNLSLAQTGISGSSATNLQNRVMLAFDSVIDPTVSPKIAEYDFKVGSVQYGVQSLAWMPLSNLFYGQLFGMIAVIKNGTFTMRGNVQPSTGQDNLQLLGLTFATGDYLTYEE